MKRCILAITIVLLTATAVHADNFQFIRSSTGACAAGAKVSLNNRLIAYTDEYGRITIQMPPQIYTFVIEYMGQQKPITIRITGNPGLQIIRF